MSYNNKTVGLIIPTRMDSERLPGKALIDINGKPNLERIIERAYYSRCIDKIILAVSDNEIESEIERWFIHHFKNPNPKIQMCLEYGPYNNIFKRTLDATHNNNIDIIVNISHCCTLFDPFLADHLIENLFHYNAEFSTNIIPRSFSDGFDIYVHTREIYERIFNESVHWNPYWTAWNIWHCREDLNPKPRIINYQAPAQWYYPEWRLTLDTEEDLKRIKDIYKHFGRIIFHYDEVIEYIKESDFWNRYPDTGQPTKLEAEPC